MKLFTLLLELALRLWDLRKSWRRKRIEKEHQDETKRLEEDPDAWFDDFFKPGVQPDGKPEPKPGVHPNNASKTDSSTE